MYNQEQFNLYDGSEPVKYISALTSTSHTYGNMIAYIQNWIVSKFPKDFFKTNHVNSKIAHRQITNTPHAYNKKQKPILAISPRVDFDDERFLKGTPLTDHRSNIYSIYGLGNLLPLYSDAEKKISMKYQMNRTVMNFDIILIMSTKMQQLNVADYIRNTFLLERGFNLEAYLEAYLSEDLLSVISDLVEIPMYDENGSTYDFLKYMKGKSIYPITYRISGARNKKEFYRYYPANIDTYISNISVDDGETQSQITNNYKITFSIRTEFYSTGFYYLFSNDPLPRIETRFDDSDILVPVFSDYLLLEDLHLKNGWELYNRVAFELENKNDTLNIELNRSMIACIDYHKANGLPLFDLIDIKIRKQTYLLLEGIHYTLDLDNLTVTFIDAEYEYYTYTMYISVNLLHVNTLSEQIADSERITYE